MVTIKDAVIRGKQEDTRRGSERLLVVVHKKKALVISIVPDSHIFWMEILLLAKDYTMLKLEISLGKVITQHSPETMSEVNKRGGIDKTHCYFSVKSSRGKICLMSQESVTCRETEHDVGKNNSLC